MDKVKYDQEISIKNDADLLTIDELSHQMEVPSRTIRYYTHEGLLPPPILKGRLGLYAKEHVKRLELIKKLQKETYLPLAVIREIVTNPERTEFLDDHIKLKEEVFASLGYELGSSQFTFRELAKKVDLPLKQIRKLEAMGLIGPEHVGGAKKYDRYDIEIAKMARNFLDAGFPIESLERFGQILGKLADEERNLFYKEFGSEIGTNSEMVIQKAKEMIVAFNYLVFNLHVKLVQRKIEKEIFEYPHPDTSKQTKRGKNR